MAGFSNEFLKKLRVATKGRIRKVTCPKCETVLSEDVNGSSVRASDHAKMLRHFNQCAGKPQPAPAKEKK